MNDVVAMQLVCVKCGAQIRNDDPEIRHPVEFLAACRARGWFCDERKPPLCPQHSGGAS